MRKETRMALSIVGLSAVTTGFLVGNAQSEEQGSFVSSATTLESTEAEATPTTSASEEPQPTASEAAEQTPTAEATATEEATQQPAAEPTQQASAEASAQETPTTTPTTGADGTYASSTVRYKFGEIQLEIQVAGGALTDITMLKATTEGRGYEQAPPLLVEAALAAGGTDFGNLSGATFTTVAFKQALEDALAQAGL